MARFVPKDKLSKKAQKELNRQRRTMWDFSPVSRAVDSKKLYNRKRNAQNRDDYGLGIVLQVLPIQVSDVCNRHAAIQILKQVHDNPAGFCSGINRCSLTENGMTITGDNL